MPVYKLEGPDGKVYTIEGPEGATADQLGAFVQSQGQSRAAAQQAADRKLYDPTSGMSTFDKAAAGVGKAIVDTGRGLGQMVGLTSRQDVQESRQRDAPLMGTGAGLAGNIAGNVGMVLAPGGAAMGAGKALSAVPGAARIAQGLMTGGKAVMLPTSIPSAAGIGAAQGLIQPSVSTEETLQNAGIGAAASAALPTLVRGAQVGKAALDPFREGGQRTIVGRALNQVAGNDAPAALANLRSAAPLVPGSMPTAGQAAGNPGIAALERTATATDPVAMNEMARRLMLQNEARATALQGVAPDRVASVGAREAATAPLYRQAYGSQIQATPELEALLQRPSMQGALTRGQSLAREQGAPLSMSAGTAPVPSPILNAQGAPAGVTPGVPASLTGRDAHLMKMGLDDMANASPMTGIGGNELRAIQGTRGEFLDEVGKQVPEYTQARKLYADMSRPINQADVVAEIAKKATNFRGDITPAAFARALRDETAQGVTGQANATMGKVMEPAQSQTLDAIRRDLLRADYAQTAGRGVGSDTVQKLAYSNMASQSGLPAWATALPRGVGVGGILQRMGDVGYRSANQEMSAKLAQALLNPADAAALMEAGTVTPQVQMLIEAMRRGGAGAGAAVPALSNAAKE